MTDAPPPRSDNKFDTLDALATASGMDAAGVLIRGAVAQPHHLTLNDLRTLPAIATGPVTINTLRTGRILRTIGDYRGAALASVLGMVSLVLPQRADFKRMVLIARADDGYAAVFSWHEVFNSPLADRLIVAYEQDGQILDPEQGPLLLVAAADRATGPRHVKRLASIEARLLTPQAPQAPRATHHAAPPI
jgi:DMSO/TMAO reductase YedYZ molybdopterin-dependent catalytic subunit